MGKSIERERKESCFVAPIVVIAQVTDLSCFPPLPSFPLRTTARSLFSPAQKQRKGNKEKGANVKRCRRMGWDC